MKRLRCSLIAVLLLVAAGCALYAARAAVLPCAARWLDVGERPAKADYVYVLGGDVNVRPLVAAAIFRAGLVKKVLVSHVDFEPGEDKGILGPQHKRICEVLRRRGVPEEDILVLGNRHRTTHDEAVSLADWLPEASTKRVIVVTNDYHTRRARWIFGQVFQGHTGTVSLVGAPVDGFGANDWWRSRQGFTTISGENIKLLGSLLFYRPVTCALGAIATAMGLLAGTWLIRRRGAREQIQANGFPQRDRRAQPCS
jgi:uncharacterized SAM-binding protein YcdF (DUF218 family)